MALRERLDGCDTIDIVAFTHPDQDHIAKAPEFFHLDHSPDHQGGDRIKITEMWVPSGTITEDASLDDAILLQKEAQHRLRHGEGIRVFSRPEELEEWFKREGIKREDRKKLCTDAGTCAPGFKLMDDGVEFFVHSPFATRQDDQTLIERNECSLVFQVRFEVDGVCTNVIMAADAPHAALTEMVNQTRSHDNEERLAWDIFKLPHHCSYLSLSDEKGTYQTVPVEKVKWLFEQGSMGGLIVCSSKLIPNGDTDQPPHVQAARYYRERVRKMSNITDEAEFVVTMEHPTRTAPEPLVITIDQRGPTREKRPRLGAASIIGRPAPRAG